MASVLDREQRKTEDPPPMWARRDLKSRLLTYARRAFSLAARPDRHLRGRLPGDHRLRPDPRALGRRDPDVGLPRPPRRARRLRPARRLGRALRGDPSADPDPGRPPDRQPPGRDERRGGSSRSTSSRSAKRRATRWSATSSALIVLHRRCARRRSACWWRSRSAAGCRGCRRTIPFAIVTARRRSASRWRS